MAAVRIRALGRDRGSLRGNIQGVGHLLGAACPSATARKSPRYGCLLCHLG